MTTEEKAKAYDDALKRAKATIDIAADKDLVGGVVRTIFPELRESEDERIRKWLIDYFSSIKETVWIPRDITCEQILGWLEKQKEQEHICDSAQYEEGFKTGLEIGLRKQKEQKPELVQQPPITYTYNSNASRDERLKAALLALLNSDLLKVKEGGYFTKQDLIEWVERIPTDKPAEWSEEDERMLERAIHIIVEYSDIDEKESEIVQNWLKSLRPQPKKGLHPGSIRKVDNPMKWMEEDEKEREQKPVTWSEEDEKMLTDISWAIRHCAYDDKKKERVMKWFNDDYRKSLRPSWKPSEEQMEAFRKYIEDLQARAEAAVGGWNNFDVMIRLYEQLKKL